MKENDQSAIVAHSPPEDRPHEWHLLEDHLEAVGRIAATYASNFGMADAARLAGSVHDLGKATDAFQTYIRESWQARLDRRPGPRPGTAPHSIHGAVLLWRWLSGPSGAGNLVPGMELAQAVLHHHGQLRNASDSRARLDAALRVPETLQGIVQAANRMEGVRQRITGTPPILEEDDPLVREIATRFLASALVDADRLDTEAFTDKRRAAVRSRRAPAIRALVSAFREDQATLHSLAPDTPVNEIRRALFDGVVARAGEAPGTFRLTIPTGGGKTRTALAFALEHAAKHGLDRVIVAIPYTSIIEQTVDVYRRILGDEAVLEHHSNIDDGASDGTDEDRWADRLPTETWDVPIIVTTTVQLFESLFSNRTSKFRKVHRLARAVIVLDEAQALPPQVMDPIVSALGTITSARYGSSVVLCTATQPALDAVTSSEAFKYARELAPDPSATYRQLARVTYDVRLDEPTSWDDLAGEARDLHQALVIVNTTADARHLAETVGDGCLHLSTRMCPAHRRATLTDVRDRLKRGVACHLVATQLIEAGVDVDFPSVYRAMAPLDSIAQAAGRCNREGRLDTGTVVVFEPEEPRLPPGYETGTREARVLLQQGADLHEPDTFQRYFETLYGKLIDLDAYGIQDLRREFRFEATNDAFRMIDDDTVPVVARDHAPAIVNPILGRFARGTASLEDFRGLQPYLVQVRRRQADEYKQNGWMVSQTKDDDGPFVWHGHYDTRFGLEPRASDSPYVL